MTDHGITLAGALIGFGLALGLGAIEINGTVIVELITFLVMMAILARYVYPQIVRLAEARQRQVVEQLKEADKARADAEAALKDAEAKLNDARRTAQSVIDAARLKAIQSVRSEVAGLVVAATERVIGETLDVAKHKDLIEKAIEEVASGNGSR